MWSDLKFLHNELHLQIKIHAIYRVKVDLIQVDIVELTIWNLKQSQVFMQRAWNLLNQRHLSGKNWTKP